MFWVKHKNKTAMENSLPTFSFKDKDEYLRKEVFQEYVKHIDERCGVHLLDIAELAKQQQETKRMILSTLLFVIITLASLLTAIVLKIF